MKDTLISKNVKTTTKQFSNDYIEMLTAKAKKEQDEALKKRIRAFIRMEKLDILWHMVDSIQTRRRIDKIVDQIKKDNQI